MALPPTIPTSFVPKPASVATRRFRTDLTGAFSFFGYSVLGVVILLTIGVFFYERVLIGIQNSKDAELAKIDAAIDPATAKVFVQLRDRLNSGTGLLDKHIAFSGFFSLIEDILPSTVRLSSIRLSIDDAKKIKLTGSGIAKSFNALAFTSTSFATSNHIKEAIFSNIVVNKDDSVSFSLSANLNPALIAFSPVSATPSEETSTGDTGEQTASTTPTL